MPETPVVGLVTLTIDSKHFNKYIFKPNEARTRGDGTVSTVCEAFIPQVKDSPQNSFSNATDL